ncbi:MAG TPA: hypothetical protein VN969_01530 [Streptosporangiaceae bacterium]|nr:hypothetical protein [Streptosporangiaceae bacterium]
MIDRDHPDPFTEAGESAARQAKLIAIRLASVGRVMLQHQVAVKRLNEEQNKQARRVMQAKLNTERTAARARWMPGNDRTWLRDAGLVDVAEVWAAAVPFADRSRKLFEKSAESAVLNCESRMRDLHPYAMARYDRLRADGMGPVEAMFEALPLFTRPAHAYERTAVTRPALEPGDGRGHEWVAVVHGPTRFDMEDGQQRERGARILDGIQGRAVRAGGVPLGLEEQRLALEVATSLTPRQIAAAVRTTPAAPTPRRPWQQDFPFPIREVVAIAAAAKQRGQDAPVSQLRPHQPEASRPRR